VTKLITLVAATATMLLSLAMTAIAHGRCFRHREGAVRARLTANTAKRVIQ
jgi:hypothetical protein